MMGGEGGILMNQYTYRCPECRKPFVDYDEFAYGHDCEVTPTFRYRVLWDDEEDEM